MTKELVILTVGRFLQGILGIISLKVATRFLSSTEMGYYFLLISLVSYFSFSLISPAGQYFNRKLHKWQEEGNVPNAMVTFSIYLAFICLVSFFMTFLIKLEGSFFSTFPSSVLMTIVPLGVFVVTMYGMIPTIFNMLGDRINFVLLSTTSLFMGLLGSVALIYLYEKTGHSWLLGQYLGLGIVGVIGVFLLKIKVNGRLRISYFKSIFNKKTILNIVKFSLPLSLSSFFMWSMNEGYRFIVEKNFGLAFLGMLSVGLSVSDRIAAVIESLVQQIYHPIYYKNINTQDLIKREIAWNDLFRVSIPIYLTTAIYVSFLSPFLITLLADIKYYDAFVYTAFGAWIHFFRKVGVTISTIAHSELETQRILFPNIIGVSIAIVGMIAVGIMGEKQMVPFVLLLSFFGTCMAMYYKMHNLIKIKLPLRLILKTIVLSIPLSIVYFLTEYSVDLYQSLLIIAVSGLYYLLVQYLIYQRKGDKVDG